MQKLEGAVQRHILLCKKTDKILSQLSKKEGLNRSAYLRKLLESKTRKSK